MKSESKVEQMLESLTGLQKADPGPFFYTRVRARLEREETGVWGRTILFLTRPAVAVATLGLILALNAAAFFYQQQTSTTGEQTEQVVSEDYNTTVAANSYYDENP